MKKLYLASPHMGGKEQVYVQEAFDTNWIAPLGPHVNEMEHVVADYVGMRGAAALSSGTAAIHLALKAVGVTAGDTVFCSSLTFAASCNPIMYEKALPVFIDSEPDTWNMSPQALERALKDYKASPPKAVVVVNLYGQSAKMDEIVRLCEKYGVPIIEDAAESLGATYRGKMSGTFGKFGIYSFNGNKIITTSGGGMVVSDDEEALGKIRFWATQARDVARHYEHSEIGYNYRMSNVSAAIGLGQMEVLEERIAQKKAIYTYYREAFRDIPYIEMMPISEEGEPNYWLSVMTLKEGSTVSPLDIMEALEKEHIESRPVWKPMHMQTVFKDCVFYPHKEGTLSVAQDLFERGVCLPSDTKMTEEDMDRVVRIIKSILKK